ncbi:unnamed protein product [Spodoptera littoralis]|uniref:FLYWCH-type domain-containing protein n=1 Tax=Spodoptera littoralis TaxID=7109 RepID=A0A9P0HWA7_SPOLI|nr:unnamed protein product [Spodoptera littoralis]CAH1635561.1 unnamed protein product [Spodoptera littoralis]
MLGGYTFAQMHSRRHWYCSKKKAGCKARIKMDVDSVTVIEAYRIHNHEPPEYYVTKNGYTLIPSGIKNQLLMLEGYTFAQSRNPIFIPTNFNNMLLMFGGFTFAQVSKGNWYCSRKKIGCKAKVKMHPDGVTIMKALNFHNHEAPQYYISDSGELYSDTGWIEEPVADAGRLYLCPSAQ